MRFPQPLICAGVGAILALSACENAKAPDGLVDLATDMGTDSCGAVSHQWLVGDSVAQLRATDLPRGTQVIFPGMQTPPISNEKRMTVIVGGGDVVTRVYCG